MKLSKRDVTSDPRINFKIPTVLVGSTLDSDYIPICVLNDATVINYQGKTEYVYDIRINISWNFPINLTRTGRIRKSDIPRMLQGSYTGLQFADNSYYFNKYYIAVKTQDSIRSLFVVCIKKSAIPKIKTMNNYDPLDFKDFAIFVDDLIFQYEFGKTMKSVINEALSDGNVVITRQGIDNLLFSDTLNKTDFYSIEEMDRYILENAAW